MRTGMFYSIQPTALDSLIWFSTYALHSAEPLGAVDVHIYPGGAPQNHHLAIQLIEAILLVYNMWGYTSFCPRYGLHKSEASSGVTLA